MLKATARRVWLAAGTAALALVLSGPASAQQASNPAASPDASNSAAPNSVKPAAPATLSNSTYATDPANNTFLDSSTQVAQPTSLAEAARLARAKKQANAKSSGPKATLLIDDDNLERGGGGINVVGGDSNVSSPDGGGQLYTGKRSGKLVLYDFWATWCGPCRQSVPDLKQLQATYGSDQLEVISVSVDKDENAWRNFVQQNGMSWEQRIDSDGQMRRQFGVTALPTFVLTDSSGRVVQRLVGEDPDVPIANRLAPSLSGSDKGIS